MQEKSRSLHYYHSMVHNMPRETRRDTMMMETEEEKKKKCDRNLFLSISFFSLFCSSNREERQKNVHYYMKDFADC